jgi:hypothetical protein
MIRSAFEQSAPAARKTWHPSMKVGTGMLVGSSGKSLGGRASAI